MLRYELVVNKNNTIVSILLANLIMYKWVHVYNKNNNMYVLVFVCVYVYVNVGAFMFIYR